MKITEPGKHYFIGSAIDRDRTVMWNEPKTGKPGERGIALIQCGHLCGYFSVSGPKCCQCDHAYAHTTGNCSTCRTREKQGWQ